MAKPSRSAAQRRPEGDLDAVHASWTIRSVEDGSVQLAQIALVSFLILRAAITKALGGFMHQVKIEPLEDASEDG